MTSEGSKKGVSGGPRSGQQKPVKPALAGVGNPDDIDRDNIIQLMTNYEARYPYPHPESIGRSVEMGLAETTRDRAKQNGGTVGRAFSLPEKFVRELKKGYPLIFSQKNQFEWFKSSFPSLDLTNNFNDRNDDYKRMGKKK